MSSTHKESVAELMKRPNLTMPEAVRCLKVRKATVVTLCTDGELQWFWEGSRRRVVTTSIERYQARQVEAAMGVAL